jgi:hypothetical protein
MSLFQTEKYDDGAAPCAKKIAHSVCRWLEQAGVACLLEFSLGNGRRVDVAGLDLFGNLVVVEIKTNVSDLRSDAKWMEYLPYCDKFFFAIPEQFPRTILEEARFMPERTGLIVANRYEAACVRAPLEVLMNGRRRHSQTLRFARKAAERLGHALWGEQVKEMGICFQSLAK